jgi:hypothetical protein
LVDIVNVFPNKLKVTPVGNPVTVTPVAEPPMVYIIFEIEVLLHTV